jgi:hypothetical protein
VLRPFDGKIEALIIDHAGAVAEHGYVDDHIPWSLDSVETVKERKTKAQKDGKEPKEITCQKCHSVFKGARRCPSCGFEMLPPTKPIPVHEADLVEIEVEGKARNRKDSWEEKAEFMAGARAYARSKGYKPDSAKWMYKERYGVWPNDERVRNVPAGEVTPEVKNWIRHQAIRKAKSNKRQAA